MKAINPLEIIGALTSLFYLWLLIKRNIWCWPFGILSSAITILLLLQVRLYTESFLNFYYLVVGFYGWFIWRKDLKTISKQSQTLLINTYPFKKNLLLILIGIITGTALGWLMSKFTNGNNPYLDAYLTIFSFIATYMEAHRVLSGWYFWIVINASSIVLYFIRDLPLYGVLMIFYTLLSLYGLQKWQKIVNNSAKNDIL
jgi:nicotinamide mononucleotide transporter